MDTNNQMQELSDLRVSVAMATYNGEKYIEEQLLSICRQTRRPDEIVISDDGSKDATLEVARRIAESEEAKGIDFVVLTDNPRHGYCGNFEWAIQHTTGDLIFLSDQDDVWLQEKVAKVEEVFINHDDVLCVVHGADLIDGNGDRLSGNFQRYVRFDSLEMNGADAVKIPVDPYLEQSVSSFIANGMVMCISSALRNSVLPFPKTKGGHDQWIGFCALCGDGCWYLRTELTHYRLHGENTCGFATHKKSLFSRRNRILNQIKKKQSAIAEHYNMGRAMVHYLEARNLNDCPAFRTAKRVLEIGTAEKDALYTGGFRGAVKLCKLYRKDIRYRRSGTANFAYELVSVLFSNNKVIDRLSWEE